MTPRLVGVHPDLVAKVLKVLKAMEALGFPMMVTSGLRTAEEQARLYAQGRTAPGKKVTNVDGVRKKSNHQAREDGFGHAVDCAFVVDGKPSWNERLPWAAYGACAKALGLTWGGDWRSLRDMPHLED